jgi:hypothetical protein
MAILRNTTVNDTGFLQIPGGTTAQRPASPVNGMIRFNSTIDRYEAWKASLGVWLPFDNEFRDGSSSTLAVRNAQDMANVSSSGTIWVQTSSMTQPTQYFVDTTTDPSQKFIRIFLAVTDNYETTSYSWPQAQTPNLIQNAREFLYAFCNTSNNALTFPWRWRFADTTRIETSTSENRSAFVNTPPMGHGGTGAPLITQITTTRIADGGVHTLWLRTGISSFGSVCDQGRSGSWGQICLKSLGQNDTAGGGFSDFPHFSSYTVNTSDHCAQSNQSYNSTSCTSSRRFSIYVSL